MEVDLSSSAGVELYGTGVGLRVSSSSGGQFKGENFSVETADLNGSSGGQMELICTQNIRANISSGAQIRYRGEAQVNVNKSSGAGIHKLD